MNAHTSGGPLILELRRVVPVDGGGPELGDLLSMGVTLACAWSPGSGSGWSSTWRPAPSRSSRWSGCCSGVVGASLTSTRCSRDSWRAEQACDRHVRYAVHAAGHPRDVPALRHRGRGGRRAGLRRARSRSGSALYALFGVVGLALGLLNRPGWSCVGHQLRRHPAVEGRVLRLGARPARADHGARVRLRAAVPPGRARVFAGLAVFQFLAVASSMVPLIKEIRKK